MRKVIAFEQVSVDGFFADARGDMSWAHDADAEWSAFAADNASSGGVLLFGRITYEMMASFWPTPMASQTAPVVARQMNALPKVVFSRTMERATWSHTELVKDGLSGTVRRMKSENGPPMVIMGSGTIVSQLADEGLIDELQLVVVPIALGSGRSLFGGMKKRLSLKRIRTREFRNGNVSIDYAPAR